MRTSTALVVRAEAIERRIYILRGQKVMLDSDLASLYGVETKHLNQAVTRNRKRFPADFMFQLTAAEARNLKSQIVTSSWGGRRNPPYVFTEQGVAMLSSVLHSERAILVNVAIMRAFVKLRELLETNRDLASRLDALERKCDFHFSAVFDAIRRLTQPPRTKRRRIGFIASA